jgi:hypothetical protein
MTIKQILEEVAVTAIFLVEIVGLILAMIACG